METVLSAILSLILSSATGEPVTLDALADDLVRKDVVFLGEEHDNTEGHQVQMEILRALHGRRPDIVLSMEMFERDVQGVMDDYLHGRIDEKEFLAHARPWKNYKKHYRPLVEFAKSNGLDVICACSPWSAKKVAERGLDPNAYIARDISDPKDRYFDLFVDAMKDHPGEIDEKALEKMYRGQCRRDDTMAESITDYLNGHPHRTPLVVHVNGRFHSDYGLGTVIRVLRRSPLLQAGVVSMVAAEDPAKAGVKDDLERGHYLLVVKAEPKKAEAKAEGKEGDDAAVAKADAVPDPVSDQEGKAALGIMPDYGSEDGVVVAAVSEGKGAEKAGIENGDRIVKIGDDKLSDLEDYMDAMSGYKPGQKAKVTFVRNGEEKTVEVTFGVSHR